MKESFAWAAGIIEGEGSVWKSKGYKGKNGRIPPCWIIQVSNTDLDILEELKEIFGGYIGLTRRKGERSGGGRLNSDYFAWRITSRASFRTAKKLIPYIKGKKKENFIRLINSYGEKYVNRSGERNSKRL